MRLAWLAIVALAGCDSRPDPYCARLPRGESVMVTSVGRSATVVAPEDGGARVRVKYDDEHESVVRCSELE